MHLDFVIPGFSKCGTTTLCTLLAEHPDLYLPPVKELNFFAWKFERGWKWYESFFTGEDGAKKRFHGEGGQGYGSLEYAEVSARRLREHFPETKLIFLARNPISRLASSYREMHHNGHVYGVHPAFSLEQALRDLPNMIDDTMYWKCITPFRSAFPENQIHVVFLEDFKREPAPVLASCFRFLGVDPKANISRPHRKLNGAAEKLYDTRMMRFIRESPWGNRLWTSLSIGSREKIERTWRLRKPFSGPVEWDAETLAFLRERLGEDTKTFLEFYGKSPDFWDLGDPARRQIAA